MIHKTSLISFAIAIAVAACGGGKKPERPEPRPQGSAVACTEEIAVVCAEGAADGCLDAKTTFHACVATTEAAGPPCEQEIAKVCGDGQVDGCLATPALSDHHLCVFTAAAAPVEASSCPAGQTQYFPGCGGGAAAPTLATEGCYAACPSGTCAAGFTCQSVNIDPCHGTGKAGELTCDACGSDDKLCMPSS